MTYRCYDCGYEAEDRGVFLATQGDGDHHWTIFQCPQCHTSPARVASTADNPPWDKPVWHIQATNYGLYIVAEAKGGGSHGAPMIASHQLAVQPADRYFSGEAGSLRDFHDRLIERGREREEAFRKDAEALREKCPTVGVNAQIEQYQAGMEVLRKVHSVGSHGPSVRVRIL